MARHHKEGKSRQLGSSLPLISGQKVVEELPIVLADISVEASEDLADGSSDLAGLVLLVLICKDFHQAFPSLLYSLFLLLVHVLLLTSFPLHCETLLLTCLEIL